ncbi:MAG TPA: DUF389 domain-containing protein [Thermoleophilia bacterium]
MGWLTRAIDAGGVVGDSTPAVIGAMIVAPLATPIYGVALAIVTESRRDLFASLRLLVAGVAVNVLLGFLVGLVTISRMPVDANPQIIGRTAPPLDSLKAAVRRDVPPRIPVSLIEGSGKTIEL